MRRSEQPIILNAKLRKLWSDAQEAFWALPAMLVACGVALAVLLVYIDRSAQVPTWLVDSGWLYNGGATGARTLLGAVASSTIGVAGTVFSITIAALSLAAGQMGPRLLRNFVRDRGNQVTLGALLGTFCYALVVLRSVRGQEENLFIPHLALGMATLLAFGCVGMLVYFVGHMADRINVDTVIDLVSEDMHIAIARSTADADAMPPPPDDFWQGATPIVDRRRGYLQHLDAGRLADWAAQHGVALRLLVRPGSYVFPGSPIALVAGNTVAAAEVQQAIRAATALGGQRTSEDDLEYAVRQLVEVGVRALSPGINDPYTAVSVIDRLGAALCDVVGVRLPTGVVVRDGRAVLVVPPVDYDGMVDAMFHMVRQNADGSPAVLIRIVDVLTAVAAYERLPQRQATLRRHARLVLDAGRRTIGSRDDLQDLEQRIEEFDREVAATTSSR